jgi:hypothetical protein
MEPSSVNNFRQKADEARQLMDRSVDPDVRRMWRDIAEHYDYLAEHIPQQMVQASGQP